MKKSIFAPLASMLLIALLGLSACDKKDDDNGGGDNSGTFATTPCSTANLATCNPGAYDQYGNANIQFTNYQGDYANGFCGCNNGYRPIMHPMMGLSCAPSNFFHPNQYGYNNSYGNGSGGGYRAWGYSYTSITRHAGQNNQWSSIPQVTYAPGLSGSGRNCYTQAAATCDLRQANPCGSNGVCRPTGGGTYLGLCSYGRGVEGYGAPNGCIQRAQNGGYYNVCGYGNGNSYGNDSYNGNNQLPVR